MKRRLLAALLAVAASCATAAEPVHVLVLAAKLEVDERLAAELAEENIHLVRLPVTQPLSLDMLRQFHVVFTGDLSSHAQGAILPSQVVHELTWRRTLEGIEAYVREGGGFLLSPDVGGQGGATAQTALLAPYGARVRALQARDDAHAYVPDPPPPRDAGYAWTTAIGDHPAARGVHCIFYPTPQHRWDDFYATPVVELTDPAWRILVRGMDGSTASRATDYVNWTVVDPAPPPIAAVRTFERGRVGLLAIMSYYTLWHPYWTTEDHETRQQGRWGRGQIGERTTGDIDGIFMERGDGERRSQGRELLIGLFRWLGESARAAGMGGYTETGFAALPVPDPPAAPDWLFRWRADPPQRNFHLLVGARSEWSDGAGSLEDYARAARAAGIDVLVMTESFAAFAPDRWSDYVQACQALGDDTLAVLPGLDIADAYGARYLLLNSAVFPQPFMLSADGKTLDKVHYLCLTFPNAITVAHRTTGSPIPHHLIKHFQGISIYTYNADGELADNSFPAWEWQLNSLANPMPFVVHEIADPSQVATAAGAGHQLYAAAPTLPDLMWYLDRHGVAHFWESPLRLQVTSGPRLTAYGDRPFCRIESEAPLREVRLHTTGHLYRRWLPEPGATAFEVDALRLPEGRVAWSFLTATDGRGGTLIAPGMHSGRQVVHTWRCADRQNWWNFPNLYPGTIVAEFDIRAPVFGTPEAAGGYLGFAQMQPPQRGDNIAPVLEFPLASSAVHIQDVWLDQRYWRAVGHDIIFDAKPAHATTRARVYRGRVRYHDFLEEDLPGLPMLKEIEMSLLRPAVVEQDIYPVFTSMEMKNQRIRGDMSYEFTDPRTGEAVAGTLRAGTVDIPPGGRIGGLLVVDGVLRVAADNRVGWPAPDERFTTLPAGTPWSAAFITVPPDHAAPWRRLAGLAGEPPYRFSLSQGRLNRLALVAHGEADAGGFAGHVEVPLTREAIEALVASTSEERKTPPLPLRSFRLPLRLAGVNPNWPAAQWTPDGEYEPIAVFEGHAWARLDLSRAGAFYAGNVLMADSPGLRLQVQSWSADRLVFEAHNPFDQAMSAEVWTAPAVADRLQTRRTLELPPGSSRIVECRAETPRSP